MATNTGLKSIPILAPTRERLRYEEILSLDKDEREITVEVEVSFSDCQSTGCSDVVLTESKSVIASIRIYKEDPYDCDIEYSNKDQRPNDYY